MNRKALQGAGFLWHVIGAFLLLAGNAGGWFFLLMGLSYFSTTTPFGQAWADRHPAVASVILVVLTVALLALTIIISIGEQP